MSSSSSERLLKSFLDDFGMATVVIPFLFEVFIISVTPQSTDSTGEFENLSNEAEELCYRSLFRIYATPIWS